MAHARALLTSSPEGRTEYIEADLRNPRAILKDPRLREALDPKQPVALMLVAVLHFITDDQQAHNIVQELLTQLAPGSYVVASHATGDFLDDATREKLSAYDFVLRDRNQFAGFLTGLDLLDPGITPITTWRPDTDDMPTPQQASVYGAVARVPEVINAGGLR